MVRRHGRFYDYDNPNILIEEAMFGAYIECDDCGFVDGQMWDDYCATNDVYIADDFAFDDGIGNGFDDVVVDPEPVGGNSYGGGGYSDDFEPSYGGGGGGDDFGGGDDGY